MATVGVKGLGIPPCPAVCIGLQMPAIHKLIYAMLYSKQWWV